MKTKAAVGPGPSALQLLDDKEVHVWNVNVDTDSLYEPDALALLSAEERDRAKGFRFTLDRRRFVLYRAMLRRILGSYLGMPPAEVAFDVGTHGKPALAGSDGTLRFNASHSHGLLVVAVAQGRDVGVDVEWVRNDVSIDEISQAFFTTAERRELRAFEGAARREAFFRGWTRKEAYVKARGDGLAFPAKNVEVSLQPGSASPLMRVSGEPDAPNQWTMTDFRPARGFFGALVVEGRDAPPTAFPRQPTRPRSEPRLGA